MIAIRLEVLGFNSFHDLLDTHLYFSLILVVVHMGEKPDILLHDGFLFKGNQFCVPDCSLRLHIIHEFYGEDHVGRDRIFQLVQDSYFWPTLVSKYSILWSVARFVRCLRVKLLTLVYTCITYTIPALD